MAIVRPAVARDPEAARARSIEETCCSCIELEVLSSDRPRATSSMLRTRWLKLASVDLDSHRRRAGVNGKGRLRAPSLCGIVVAYRGLNPQLAGLPGECTGQAEMSFFHKLDHFWFNVVYFFLQI